MSNKENIDNALKELISLYKSIPEGHFPQEVMESLGENLGKLQKEIEKIEYDANEVYDETKF